MIHTLAFGAQDAAGNVLPAGNPVTLIVDTLPPAMPIVTSVDPNGTLVSGTADAGSTVIIRSGSTILGGGGRRFRYLLCHHFTSADGG